MASATNTTEIAVESPEMFRLHVASATANAVDPQEMFRLHFNIPNLIGNVPTESNRYTNLFGIVNSRKKNVFLLFEDVREILLMKKEEISPTFFLKDCFDGGPTTTTPLLRMVELNNLLDFLEKRPCPKKLFDLYSFLETKHVLELPKKNNIRQLHPCLDSIGQNFGSWVNDVLHTKQKLKINIVWYV